MISNIDVRRLSLQKIQVTWTANTPGPFYVYYDGALIGHTTSDVMNISVSADQYGVVDVFDDPNTRPSLVYPSVARLGWWRVTIATAYVIEQYVDSAWAELATVVADDRQFYVWVSDVLADDTDHVFRITPYKGDFKGTPMVRHVHMVRRPDPPATAVTYDPDTFTFTIETL